MCEHRRVCASLRETQPKERRKKPSEAGQKNFSVGVKKKLSDMLKSVMEERKKELDFFLAVSSPISAVCGAFGFHFG